MYVNAASKNPISFHPLDVYFFQEIERRRQDGTDVEIEAPVSRRFGGFTVPAKQVDANVHRCLLTWPSNGVILSLDSTRYPRKERTFLSL